RLAGFLGAAAGIEEEQAKNFQWGLRRYTLNHLMLATTTTLAVTTGIPVMGVTRETGVSSPTDLPILVLSSLGVPLRATPTQFALLVDVDTHEIVVELL
nr:hypothetical protein [Tanacetum cinerariifolium]